MTTPGRRGSLWPVHGRGAAGVLVALVAGCAATTGLDVPVRGDPGGPADACLELGAPSGPADIVIPYVLRIATADVVFLVDVTGSMGGEVAAIRDGLRTRLAPALFATIPGTRLGVATFADFPVSPHGSPADMPFALVQRPTEALAEVEEAVASLLASGGNDAPESMTEALFQLAEGTGAAGFVPPARCPAGTGGGGCFRPDATPVILLLTDAGAHNGPGGEFAYTAPEVRDLAARYDEARDALRRRGARVLGLFSGVRGDFRAHLDTVARDTGAVGEDGVPLVFDIGMAGERLDEGVAALVGRLVEESPVDVDLVLRDGAADDGDALALVSDIVVAAPVPASGARVVSAGYESARPGTRLSFTIRLRDPGLTPGPEPRRFRLEATLRGDGAVDLLRRRIDVVVPSLTGEGCPQTGA